jgi:hypothetical protein
MEGRLTLVLVFTYRSMNREDAVAPARTSAKRSGGLRDHLDEVSVGISH